MDSSSNGFNFLGKLHLTLEFEMYDKLFKRGHST